MRLPTRSGHDNRYRHRDRFPIQRVCSVTAVFDLPEIPVVDVREGGPVRHARESVARARMLRDDCLGWFPRPAKPLVPLLDALARHWLRRSSSPYLTEIEAIAALMGFPGVWFLNGSYQWGCTTLARGEGGVNWLVRTLDWPFPGLGRHAEVARMRGPAGEFCSITWSGYVGALTAMAPGRFAACVNQAPMWRRSRSRWLRFFDMAANAMHTWRNIRHIPPDQLLRQVFETCRSFEEAKRRLESVPVARPVIFTLAGCGPGERCVIERTEDTFATRHEDTSAANDWLVPAEGWEARVGGRLAMVCSSDEAAANSRERRAALHAWDRPLSRGDFSWVVPPVLNPFTRLAVAMAPAEGILRVVGYEQARRGDLPAPVTRVCEVQAAAAA
jgi:hypothetical protein